MRLEPPFYVISDTHWFHKNIVRYANRPMGHNEIMVKRWHETVTNDDVVLHLGDVVFTRNKEKNDRFFDEIGPNLPGDKYLILGNHDPDEWIERYEAAGFKVIDPFGFDYLGWYVDFDHYPLLGLRHKQRIRVHGHIHNNTFHEEFTSQDLGGNVNVSVEVIDYTPQPIVDLLDRAIA